MSELFPIPLNEQIACVEREINLRRGVYARRVSAKMMSADMARREIARMEAVRETLIRLRDDGANKGK
jgi:hypothetical protein